MHIEVDSSVDVMESHDLIDTIEKNLSESLNILLTVHMDPVDINNPYREPLTHILKDVLSGIPGTLGFHDLRIVPGTTHTNVIFDVVLSHECELSQKEISDILKQKVSEFNSSFLCVIEYDMNYAGTKK